MREKHIPREPTGEETPVGTARGQTTTKTKRGEGATSGNSICTPSSSSFSSITIHPGHHNIYQESTQKGCRTKSPPSIILSSSLPAYSSGWRMRSSGKSGTADLPLTTCSPSPTGQPRRAKGKKTKNVVVIADGDPPGECSGGAAVTIYLPTTIPGKSKPRAPQMSRKKRGSRGEKDETISTTKSTPSVSNGSQSHASSIGKNSIPYALSYVTGGPRSPSSQEHLWAMTTSSSSWDRKPPLSPIRKETRYNTSESSTLATGALSKGKKRVEWNLSQQEQRGGRNTSFEAPKITSRGESLKHRSESILIPYSDNRNSLGPTAIVPPISHENRWWSQTTTLQRSPCSNETKSKDNIARVEHRRQIDLPASRNIKLPVDPLFTRLIVSSKHKMGSVNSRRRDDHNHPKVHMEAPFGKSSVKPSSSSKALKQTAFEQSPIKASSSSKAMKQEDKKISLSSSSSPSSSRRHVEVPGLSSVASDTKSLDSTSAKDSMKREGEAGFAIHLKSRKDLLTNSTRHHIQNGNVVPTNTAPISGRRSYHRRDGTLDRPTLRLSGSRFSPSALRRHQRIRMVPLAAPSLASPL